MNEECGDGIMSAIVSHAACALLLPASPIAACAITAAGSPVFKRSLGGGVAAPLACGPAHYGLHLTLSLAAGHVCHH